MTYDPFKNARREDRRESGQFSLGIGQAVTVPDDSAHQIVIQAASDSGPGVRGDPFGAEVMVSEVGDVTLPSEGDLVVFGRFKNDRIVVLGSLYSDQDDVRPYDAGERHLYGNDGVYLDGPFGVVPKRSDDPADPDDGAVWYDESTHEYMGVEDGTVVSFDTTPV